MFQRSRRQVQTGAWEYKILEWNFEFASFRENGSDPFIMLSKEDEEIFFDKNHARHNDLRRDLIIRRDQLLVDLLNRFGREGWELVKWEGATYVFKRPRPGGVVE
ncbi:MAG: hypothetical protein NTZ05_13490 [Chloroflexi bacterium]|nr:hypothetical protein [Chloroflexota bacterium]